LHAVDAGAGDLQLVAAGERIEMVIANAVTLKRIRGGDGESGVGVNRGERGAGRAGGGGCADGDGGARDGMAGGAEDDVVFARTLRASCGRGDGGEGDGGQRDCGETVRGGARAKIGRIAA
jgi:hypothetical protein